MNHLQTNFGHMASLCVFCVHELKRFQFFSDFLVGDDFEKVKKIYIRIPIYTGIFNLIFIQH